MKDLDTVTLLKAGLGLGSANESPACLSRSLSVRTNSTHHIGEALMSIYSWHGYDFCPLDRSVDHQNTSEFQLSSCHSCVILNNSPDLSCCSISKIWNTSSINLTRWWGWEENSASLQWVVSTPWVEYYPSELLLPAFTCYRLQVIMCITSLENLHRVVTSQCGHYRHLFGYYYFYDMWLSCLIGIWLLHRNSLGCHPVDRSHWTINLCP